MSNRRIKTFMADESGAAVLENALAVAIIGAAALFALSMLGISVSQVFSTIANAIFG